MRRGLIASILLLAVTPHPILAQERVQIRPGDRVRISAPKCELGEVVGTLLSIDNEHLSATVGDKDIHCPVHALTQLDVSVGERKWWKPALVGFGLGVGVGVVGASVIWRDEWREDTWNPPFAQATMWTMATIAIGTITGAEIGRRRGTDRWEEVPLPLIRPSFLLWRGGRIGVGLSVPLRR